MNPVKLAFFDAKPYEERFFNDQAPDHPVDITYFPNRLKPETVRLSEDFDTVCAFINDNLNADVIQHLADNDIKLIALRSAGYNNVDLQAAFDHKIHVVRVPAYSPEAVAEHALTLMMTLNRKTHKSYFRTRDNNFTINGLIGFNMRDKTIGIIGTGKIGKVMVDIARGLGMNILAFDPYPDEDFAKKRSYQYVSLEDLLSQSDIITLHCPLTPDNVHMINAERISKMKKGVMIINTGRGKLIDTAALLDALKDEHVGYAGLDVYEEETDYFFEDYSESVIEDDVLARLLTFPNVLITGHQGFFTREAMANIAQTTLDNITSYFRDNELPNEICYRCCRDGGQCQRKETGRCF